MILVHFKNHQKFLRFQSNADGFKYLNDVENEDINGGKKVVGSDCAGLGRHFSPPSSSEQPSGGKVAPSFGVLLPFLDYHGRASNFPRRREHLRGR